MKNYCCLATTSLLVVIIGLQIYIISQIKKTPSNPPYNTSVTAIPTKSLSPTITPLPTTKVDSEEQLIVEVNNISACSFTDKAEFSLKQDYLITRIRTWYSWDQNENTTPYKLLKDGQEITSGNLVRKDCDPYQRQWCIAADFEFNKNLGSGNYILQLTKNKICQNSGSSGKGFIYVWGK